MWRESEPLLRNLARAGTLAITIATVATFEVEVAAQRTLSHRFVVTADNCEFDLGSWSKATGLDVTWDLAEYRAGDAGNNSPRPPRHLRESFNDGTITLSRAAGEETNSVQEWLARLASTGQSATVTILLIDALGQVVTTWELDDVMPRKWSISGFDAGASNAATETLVLAHEGFFVAPPRSECERVSPFGLQ